MAEIVAENISIINSDELECRDRVDPEYYRSGYLELQRTLSKLNPSPLNQLVKSIMSFGAYSLTNEITYCKTGIPFIRCVDMKSGIVDFSDVVYIDEYSHKLLWKSEVKPEQLLLSMSGSVGESAVASPDWPYPINSNQDIAKITLKDNIDPYFVAVFFNSEYGRFQTARLPVGSIQQHIFLWQIGLILVPTLDSIQQEISCIAKEAERNLMIAKEKHEKAVALLLEELGIKNIDLSHEHCCQVNSEEVVAANRIDAEYYQPKYERVIKAIEKYPKGFTFVKDEFIKIKDSFSISEDIFYQYIEIGSVNISTSDINCLYIEGKELPVNAKIITKGGELIISKVRPTRGAITIIPEAWDSVICSGAFVVLKENGKLQKEVLAVFLKSFAGKEILGRPVTGTSYPTITDDDILNIPIPLIDDRIQNTIAELVRQSHSNRYQAKALLEEAKHKVEDMIERGQK